MTTVTTVTTVTTKGSDNSFLLDSHHYSDESFKENEKQNWLELTTPKQFSRLLYTNPVCLLSTTKTFELPSRNVMVLSWLTATNNDGLFMFSLNKRRHTASMFLEGHIKFCLSVPVKGMEPLILDVGKTSGRFGSKFTEDYHGKPSEQALDGKTGNEAVSHRKHTRLSKGVPGLKSVPIGYLSMSGDLSDLSAIDGTVAHLKCKSYQVIKEPVIDEDHFLVLAQVEAAFVHKDYWNVEKHLFQPQHQHTPPYLTFFGSQTFGYINVSSC